ncbi:AraC family transcriptional regulator [Dyadobacter luteus]|jgi:AraC-like DNA-binding protein|uniref:AraC family transcriptional regulator n=1 Tax=Dyadobacter luteus TaxID=2259619 RepID=A0A3D8YAT0_9BACT|nr:AraC family transcriptional regulator [Dyadobacter luteus]REA60875.1 AraC family transcriptional regulator [Dyadobacter luteus]
MKVLQFTPPVPKEDAVVIEEDLLPHFYNFLHRHKELQVTLIIRGEGTLIAGNYSQAFKSGDVYVIGANQPHIFKSDPAYFDNLDKQNAHAIHIFFDLERIPQAFMNLPEMGSIKKFVDSCTTGLQLPVQHTAHVGEAIKKMVGKPNLERLLSLLEVFQYFAKEVTGWKSLSTGFSNYPFPESEGNRMNDIFQYTLENYAENITLNKIASIAHITPHAFCKYFKQHTRKTYNNFLNEVRINEACKKIISGDYDGISTIAYKTGFNSAINFNRVFKKTTGMSPSDYKKEFRHKSA